MARRVRKHANPFSCTVELGRLDRMALFGREAPLEVEIGSASGSYLFALARAFPERDFVGIEVRMTMVEVANERLRESGLTNAAVLYANANVNLSALAAPGVIERFHVHFPDPWPKKRHRKRRQVQPSVVRKIAALLPIGGTIYAQSDVQPLAAEMFGFIAGDGAFEARTDPSMLVQRPVPATTDWEAHHEARGEPIYRMVFEKVREPSGPVAVPEFAPTGPLGDRAAAKDAT